MEIHISGVVGISGGQRRFRRQLELSKMGSGQPSYPELPIGCFFAYRTETKVQDGVITVTIRFGQPGYSTDKGSPVRAAELDQVQITIEDFRDKVWVTIEELHFDIIPSREDYAEFAKRLKESGYESKGPS